MAGSKKGPIYAAMAANLGIAIAKFIASGITGSSAMLSEGIHSLVDTGNGFLLLYGINRSKKAPDEAHPFGYGKEVYFWSLVVAVLIFAVGGGMSFYEGIIHLQHPEPMGDPTINYIVLAVAMVFEGAALFAAMKSFNKTRGRRGFWEAVRRSKDPTSFAVIFEDGAALLGLAVAMLGVYLGHTFQEPMFDGAASIVIGILLTVISILLAYESKALLIGESAEPEMVDQIKDIVMGHDQVLTMNTPITMHMAPDQVLLALDVEFSDELESDEIEKVVAQLEAKIRANIPIVKRIFIEAKAISTPRN
ncbi:cation diffusion facilitator family transporter [Pontibacter sp. G13]|uniref:cation diffusion facilitator family transporter n=1 Tax=Pontibacter sp. G13 TaxID=3074898 RepID=UPI00288A8CEA|nr:cation diffusion facilitator family transporter [Pontibacter sp. G13]WNJ21194.1 cation diffusion facilitator family transporter [Pontibacter sp. G13]